MKISHLITGNDIYAMRRTLNNCSTPEEGLSLLLNLSLPALAVIQHSWFQVGERLIRYEDLPNIREKPRPSGHTFIHNFSFQENKKSPRPK